MTRRTQRSQEAQAYRAWYGTKRWQQLRWSILVRDAFKCQECGRLEAKTSRLVANHITPHKGDAALFWNPDNLQCVCKPCHDSHIQSLEKGGPGKAAIGIDGWPVSKWG